MKILLISSFLPYPLFSGGHVRLYNLIKHLSERHEITLICEKRDYQSTADLLEVEKICKKVIAVKRYKQWSLQNIFKAIFSSQPFLIVGHTNSELTAKIKLELNSNKFDLIHCETFYIYQNIPETLTPTVLVEHNIEFKVYQRFVDKTPFLLRPLLQIDIKKLKRIEEKCWRAVTQLVAVSEEEKEQMGIAGVEVIPNGVDLSKFTFKGREAILDRKVKSILFIGDFRWLQNVDSAQFIISDIWPLIKKKINQEKFSLNLQIVGQKIPNSIKSLASNDKSVIFVEDRNKKTEEIFSQADILLAPKRIGGGTSYKILEAMACGTPVITDSLGANGLRVKYNEDICIAQDSEDFAKLSIKLLTDKAFYQQISVNGRKTVEKNYDWRYISDQLNRLYLRVAKEYGEKDN